LESSFTATTQTDANRADQCRAELAIVLASDAFKRSPKISLLLSYLCDKYFDGQAGEIKEYSIAVDVLGRDTHFDPHQDAVVRVDIHHLRKRLKEYYAAGGRDHEIHIVIPSGQYTPQFISPSDQEAAGRKPAPEKEPSGLPPVSVLRLEKPKVDGRNWQRPFAGMALVAISGWLLTSGGSQKGRAEAENAVMNEPAKAASAVLENGTGGMRIAVGRPTYDYIDRAGRTWLADQFFSGGSAFHREFRPIERTTDPELYESGRQGQFAYNIPLSPGVYEVHLYFAETSVASDALRNFAVAINGKPALPFLDVASDAGGINTATTKIFKDVSPEKDGLLHLAFQSTGDNSFLNAIEVVSGIPGKTLPIRLTTQDVSYSDSLGRLWIPDRFSVGGRKSHSQSVLIQGTPDPALYQAARVGHFNYSIPVAADGRYKVTLYFTETYFVPPSGHVGSRVFDVYCNGATVLKNFDILNETNGKAYTAVVKEFHGIQPSPQGKIDLTFVPVVNYAIVNAIEVAEE